MAKSMGWKGRTNQSDPASSFKQSKSAKLSNKAKNWDKVRDAGVDRRQGTRNVHEAQQMDRGQFDPIQTKKKPIVAAIVVFLALFFVMWGIVSVGEMFVGMITSFMSSTAGGVSALWGGAPSGSEAAAAEETGNPLVAALTSFGLVKLMLSVLVPGIVAAVVYQKLLRQMEAQNMMNRTDDVNLHEGDSYIQMPEEVHQRHNIFPDVGAHSAVSPTSVISHSMLSAKGLKKVEVVQRAKEDVYEDGELVYLKGEALRDANGELVKKKLPIVDVDFGKDLFKASGIKDKSQVRFFDATQIPYNPGDENRDKIKGAERVSDLINNDWEFPEYETQRPAGFYVVDTAPVNTMVLAITRGGKGQTIIEPTLDMWMREKRPNNILANDPKGELLVKNYVRATLRGFQVIQFNLINPMKTDIYNPLGMAAEAARQGDFFKCAQYVEDIADVFFPVDGGDDPVWPNAANNAFKRAAYGLIDYYLEEENQLRNLAFRTDMDQAVLENRLDEMWGKVTLYNCYQFFVQLTSKKMKAPGALLKEKIDKGELDEAEMEYEQERVAEREFLWEGKPETDMLSLYFSATEHLPSNGMRNLINNANNALKSMAGAEKMLSSVYGIAITAMSFFTDPTISTLTSGTPSQNTDLGGMSFPRRMGVRFHANFMKKNSLAGLQARWDAFEDPGFTKNLGKDFEHEDVVRRDGWARYFFEGLFPNETSYIRLRLLNSQTGALVRSYYFSFTKGYQTNLSGAQMVKDPITGKKIVLNGVLVELVKPKDAVDEDQAHYVPGHSTFTERKLEDVGGNNPTPAKVQSSVFISNMAKYTERPKMVFLVTPPHLMKYAKLILILLRQMVNLNFESSYMTKSNQKPLYKTRYMLDELGNLQSEGHGISGFETMLSIGLGQDQQFTLILQTLQQLKDVYGDSVDKIVQGNTSNIIFLKSTDDSMIETLSKMSGERHVTYRDSKTVTKDVEKVMSGFNVEGKIGYTMSTSKEPVIKPNDLQSLEMGQSIVFRAGDPVIWNRNETVNPMSFMLFKNTIIHPGHDYSLQTIPTLSTAADFDVRLNQPNFYQVVNKRIEQAVAVADARERFQEAYEYADHDMERLDPDVMSAEIMSMVESRVAEALGETMEGDEEDESMAAARQAMMQAMFEAQMEDDEETISEARKKQAEAAVSERKVFAGEKIAPADLVVGPNVVRSLEDTLVNAYLRSRAEMERDRENFSVNDRGDLCTVDGQVLVRKLDLSDDVAALSAGAGEEDSGVYGEGSLGEAEAHGAVELTDEFYRFLADQSSWLGLANGRFESEVDKVMSAAQ